MITLGQIAYHHLMEQRPSHARDDHEPEEERKVDWSPEIKFVRDVRDCTHQGGKRADNYAGSAERGRGTATPRRSRTPPRHGVTVDGVRLHSPPPHRPRSPPMDMEDALRLYWQEIDAAKAHLLSRLKEGC